MLSDHLCIFLKRKVTGIQQMHLAVGQIVLERLRTGWAKDRIILAPHGQPWRLVRPQIPPPFGTTLRTGAIGLETGLLDISIFSTRPSPLIKRPRIGAELVLFSYT